jgi:FMN phosphatase YigB (HAD superfamily)
MKVNAEQHPTYTWLKTKGIRGLLLDLDDTLIKTSEIFNAAKAEVFSLYSKVLPNLSPDEISTIFANASMIGYQEHAVNPVKWRRTILEFEAALQIQNSLSEDAIKLLEGIYNSPIEFEEGAKLFLELIKSWQMKVGLVTHANVEWTLFKLKLLGLSDFFDLVEIVDENKAHKDHFDWQQAAEKMEIPAAKLLAVGDNIRGDVQSASTAGFGVVVWIDKKNGWQYYREGNLPAGVLVASALNQLLQPDSLKKII